MNRGVGKRPLFEDVADGRFFLARLAEQVREGRIEVHAYCLMATHFHLLLRSPTGELSEAMRRVQNEHSRYFNRKRKRDGTLIRGRYASKPVRSLAYRRTLVGYIDRNPTKAGVVRKSSDYPLGSARAYLRPAGPRWLSREWVESEVCRAAGVERYSPSAYPLAFGGARSRESDELVEARIDSTAIDDPLDDLVGAGPARVRAWLQRKAILADGCRAGLPVCGRKSLEVALADELGRAGPWYVEDGEQVRGGDELALVGLLRDLCGLSWAGVALAAGATVPVTRKRFDRYRQLLTTDAEFARRCARVGEAAVERSTARPPARARVASSA